MFKELFNILYKYRYCIMSLFFLFFIFKKYNVENFNVVDVAMNSLDVNNKNFNNIFSQISGNEVTINKNTNINGNIKGKGNLTAGGNIYSTGTDIELNNQSRKGNKTGSRRALVHDGGDALTVNYGGDYSGGVNIRGTTHMDELCIGNTCINQQHLNILTGNQDFALRFYKRNGTISDDGTVKSHGGFEKGDRQRIRLYTI